MKIVNKNWRRAGRLFAKLARSGRKARARPTTILVREKKNLKLNGEGLDGLCVQDSRTKYRVYVNSDQTTLDKIIKLTHELVHAALFVYCPGIDETKEHKYIEELEKANDRLLRKWIFK